MRVHEINLGWLPPEGGSHEWFLAMIMFAHANEAVVHQGNTHDLQ
jgi:hypothetical protein